MANISQQADGRAKFAASTSVKICYTDTALSLQYTAGQEQLFLNNYEGCNTEMWNNEVVEIFIAPSNGTAIITEYHEVECSPHNSLYVAKIHNPYGNGTDKTNTLLDCAQSGITHGVTLERQENIWSTQITLPWALLVEGRELPTEWRINLFRVLMLNASASKCDDTQCRYGAWSPTDVFPSNYHVSTKLGTMRLV